MNIAVRGFQMFFSGLCSKESPDGGAGTELCGSLHCVQECGAVRGAELLLDNNS